MINYILKRFKKIVIRILSLMFFLIFLFMIFLYLNYINDEYSNPNYIYSHVKNNKSNIYLNEKNKEFLNEKNIWSIRLDKNGKVIESFKLWSHICSRYRKRNKL